MFENGETSKTDRAGTDGRPAGAVMIGPDGVEVLDPLLAELADAVPSPQTLAAVFTIHARRDRLGESDRMTLAGVWDRHLSFLTALTWQAIATAVGPAPVTNPGDPLDDFAREELAVTLGVGPGTAHDRMGLARALTTRFPRTLAELAAGQITPAHARILVQQTRPLSDDLAAAVEDRIVGRQRAMRPGQYRSELTRIIAALDPAGHAKRHAKAVKHRSFEIFFDRDVDDQLAEGMATLWLRCPALQAAQIWNAVENRVQQAHLLDDGRSMDERRADAAVDLLLRRDTDTPVEVTATIDVVIDWDTLLGLNNQPAELVGYGPMPADLARALAADATFRRLVTDPVTGYLLDHGHRVYRTPAPLARYLRARWRTCTAPGCPKPAARCDLDHRTPFANDGLKGSTFSGQSPPLRWTHEWRTGCRRIEGGSRRSTKTRP